MLLVQRWVSKRRVDVSPRRVFQGSVANGGVQGAVCEGFEGTVPERRVMTTIRGGVERAQRVASDRQVLGVQRVRRAHVQTGLDLLDIHLQRHIVISPGRARQSEAERHAVQSAALARRAWAATGAGARCENEGAGVPGAVSPRTT